MCPADVNEHHVDARPQDVPRAEGALAWAPGATGPAGQVARAGTTSRGPIDQKLPRCDLSGRLLRTALVANRFVKGHLVVSGPRGATDLDSRSGT